MIGAVGYPLYVGGLWYFDRHGQEWFPYLGMSKCPFDLRAEDSDDDRWRYSGLYCRVSLDCCGIHSIRLCKRRPEGSGKPS
jgi:hypothetical protein